MRTERVSKPVIPVRPELLQVPGLSVTCDTNRMKAHSSDHLSQEDFLHAVLQAHVHTAVFDFDGTLWPGDAGSGFMHWSIDTGLLSNEAATHLRDRHAAYRRGEIGEIPICGEMTQIYRGLTDVSVQASVVNYFKRHVQPLFFPSMLNALAGLQQQGVEIWVVSSTNSWMIEEGVRELGVPPHRVLAAGVVVQDGLITEDLLQVPSDQGKAEALLRVGLSSPDAVFGNSVHDIHMLRMARLPFAVNPSLELAAYSERHGWPIYYPEKPL